MTAIPAYEERPVPDALQGVVRRIMRVAIDDVQDITIPARPTGYAYVGWFCKGSATAAANGVVFVLREGQIHISGQLSTFDASFTLKGPCVQYLAELAPDAAYRFWQGDVGALCNRIEMQEGPDVAGRAPDDVFVQILSELEAKAGETMPEIAAAAAAIEAANGDVSIAALVADSGMTDRQFRRQFNKVVGLPPKSFANIRRVLFALRLMAEDPTQGIADVANAAGFYDQSHLNRAFNQYLRSTPAKLAFDEDGVLRSIVAGA